MKQIKTPFSCSALLLPILMLALSYCPQSLAEGILDWQKTSIHLARGYTYELGPDTRTVVTFEHSNGYKYGDNYLFFDYTNRTNSYYSEWRTRLSLSKVTGKRFSLGAISDVSIAAQFEFPSDIENRSGFGIGLSWNVPGFQFMSTNFFSRDDPRFDGRAMLVALNWGATWDFGAPVRFEGYCDFQSSEGTRGSWVNCTPRILLDVGHFSGRDGHLFAGVEYQYWSDKFGAGVTDEHVLQAQLKYTF